MDTHPITMTNYALDWERQTHLNDIFWLPGVGDHGGGPTRDMLEVAQRWQHSPFFPHLTFTRAEDYLQKISRGDRETRGREDEEMGKMGEMGETRRNIPIQNPKSKIQNPHAPIWNNELYLELHRGCYTNHADQKRWNRLCEGLLYQAELLASLATIIAGTAYPQQQLEDAWKKVLFNQFHDILPGTSIPEVFVEANAAWQAVERVGSAILETSLNAIASQVTLPSPPHPDAQAIFVFNPLNWQRRELVAVTLPNSANRNWSICDLAGEKIPSQFSGEEELLFLARDIPSIGYRVFWLCPTPHPVGAKGLSPLPMAVQPEIDVSSEDFVLENDMLRVVVDPKTGDLSRVFDKRHQRDVLNGAGNQLQAFEDSGQYWDAWNIDPNYAQHPLPPTQLRSIEWIERGSLRSRLRVVRQLGQSQFCQDYWLAADLPVLKIATTVDWQERHVLVKAAFPLNLEANCATYEIACGAIDRPTRPQTPAEKAKWEVCGLRWANLGDEDYGVSLLNDCKYGYDAQPSQLRLTLLRGSTWPDPDADFGIHRFTYALYPHQGSWQAAGTVHRGYELNLPLLVQLSSPVETENKSLPPVACLLDLQAENLILMALKRSEDNSEAWILRCYECVGESVDATLTSEVGLSLTDTVDLLERSTQSLKVSGNRQSFLVPPWRVASFLVKVDGV
jgi:alpha-mannosidase